MPFVPDTPAPKKGRFVPDTAPAAPADDRPVWAQGGAGGAGGALYDRGKAAMQSPTGRFLLGAAEPVLGLAQSGLEMGRTAGNAMAGVADRIGLPTGDAARSMANGPANYLADAIQKAAALRKEGANGTDIAGTAGAITTGVLATKGMPTPAGLLARTGVGAAAGALGGASVPVENPYEDFWQQKAMQAGGGAVAGGAVNAALPAVIHGTQAVGRAGRNIADTISGSPPALDRLATAWTKRIVGQKGVPSVARDLSNPDPILAGGKPTAAEAVAGNPYGSPIQAAQRMIAQRKGGISGDFGARADNQAIVRGSAELERDAVTKPLREAALSAANKPIDTAKLANSLTDILKSPETQAVTPARNFLGKIAEDAVQAGDAQGLYGVRKYIDDLIEKRVESPENVAAYSATQLIKMKKAIDEAIRDAGAGSKWDDYLKEYARRSRKIDASTLRAEGMYKPTQGTSIEHGEQMIDEGAPRLPNLLSREAMITNFVMKLLRGNVEPKLEARIGELMLDPKAYGALLQSQSGKKALMDALARRSTPTAAAAAMMTNQ